MARHTSGAEEFIMKGPPRRIRQAFLTVFDLTSVKEELQQLFKDPSDALEDAESREGTDEVALDERLAYKRKVTKWVKATIENVESFAFWFVVHASHKAREPLTAFFAKVCKDGAEGLSVGSGPARDYPIVKLICRRIPEIQAMFLDLLLYCHVWIAECFRIAAHTVTRSHDDSTNPNELADIESLNELAFNLAVQNLTAFERRVAQPFSRLLAETCFPIKFYFATTCIQLYIYM